MRQGRLKYTADIVALKFIPKHGRAQPLRFLAANPLLDARIRTSRARTTFVSLC